MNGTRDNSETTVEVWDGRSMVRGQESDIKLARTNWGAMTAIEHLHWLFLFSFARRNDRRD